ncbi:MAG: tyrosinase family protein [Egibacteraceae bacterium]
MEHRVLRRHRRYLRELEKALQAEVASVTIPHWDWADHVDVVGTLFTNEFLGLLRVGAPGPVTDSVFRNPVPPAQRPAWWRRERLGYPIHPLHAGRVRLGVGQRQRRGRLAPDRSLKSSSSSGSSSCSPTSPPSGFLAGPGGRPPADRRSTHTRGTTSSAATCPEASPNDPVFWLHHANVDRLWANSQARRLGDVPGSSHQDHDPPPAELSPSTASRPRRVTGGDAFDTETMDAEGYRYAAPGGP